MSLVQLSEEEISEFKIEAIELLDLAEEALLALDKGAAFAKNYDAIFRAFHSVKGASGMLNWTSLQHHMHQLENHFQSCKHDATLSKNRVSYFLNGIDASRAILDLNEVEFIYELPTDDSSSMNNKIKNDSPHSKNEVKDVNEDKIEDLSHSTKSESYTKQPSINDKINPKVTVFVLDDEKDIVEIISETLMDAGFEVFGFIDAEEALKQVSIKKPQAFFTDMNMPDLSGLDVLRKLNQIDSDIPLVYVSAHLSKEVLIESLNFGVFSAIEKPFSGKHIISTAQAATRKFQLWRLLNRSINFVMYQYSALDEYLTSKGLDEIREIMNKEINTLIELRRELRSSNKKEIEPQITSKVS